MREIAGRDFHFLARGFCLACDGDQFQPGPRGGSAQNVECVGCGARYNVLIVGNELVFAQAIGHRSTGSDWSDYERESKPRTLFEGRRNDN